MTAVNITIELACKLIEEQFPKYASLPIVDIDKQDNISRYFHYPEGGNPEQYIKAQ